MLVFELLSGLLANVTMKHNLKCFIPEGHITPFLGDLHLIFCNRTFHLFNLNLRKALKLNIPNRGVVFGKLTS